MTAEPLVLTERDDPIAVVLLNRPKQLNALSGELMTELVAALEELDADDAVRCIVLGGSERAFAAGADIQELASGTPISLYQDRRIDRWDVMLPSLPTPPNVLSNMRSIDHRRSAAQKQPLSATQNFRRGNRSKTPAHSRKWMGRAAHQRTSATYMPVWPGPGGP